MPFKSFTWSLYRSKAMWRLMAESLAWKAAKTHVFSTELGCGTLQIWKDILKDPPPLSPPIFTQISSSGIIPSCHVNLLFLESYTSTGSYYRRPLLILYTFTSHSGLGVGTPSDQGLAHSTKLLGASPLHLASREKRKGEPPKPGLYPPQLVLLFSSSFRFQLSLLSLSATCSDITCVFYFML